MIKVPFILNHVCCDLLRCCRLSAKMLCCCRSNPGHGFVLLPWAARGLPLSFHSSPKKLSRVTLNPWYNSCCIKVSREKCLVVTKTVNVRRLTLRISNGSRQFARYQLLSTLILKFLMLLFRLSANFSLAEVNLDNKQPHELMNFRKQRENETVLK